MDIDEEIQEHDAYIAALDPQMMKRHLIECPLCKERSYLDAEADAISRGFPEMENGSGRQIGYANVIRNKMYAKHKDAVLPIIQMYTEAEWWIENRQILTISGLNKGNKLLDILEHATIFLKNPTLAKIKELETKLENMRNEHKKEIKKLEQVLNRKKSEFDLQEAALELDIQELRE